MALNETRSRFSDWDSFLFFLELILKHLGDSVVFIGEHVSSVRNKMLQLYWDQDFLLTNLSNVEYLHPQETFLLHMMCGKEHHHAEKIHMFIHDRRLDNSNYSFRCLDFHQLLTIFFYHHFDATSPYNHFNKMEQFLLKNVYIILTLSSKPFIGPIILHGLFFLLFCLEACNIFKLNRKSKTLSFSDEIYFC